ncbi:MAG: PAS domain S-box protein [Acidobacteriia bacterium]|nr:PAS domain S-box protein [Terriglobia bacterium]
MNPERKREVSNIQARWSRLSLRSKGVAVLSVPLAALFIAMFSVYRVEGNVRDSDQTVVRAYETRAALFEFRFLLLEAVNTVSRIVAPRDTSSRSSLGPRESTERSLAGLRSLAGESPASAAILREVRPSAEEEMRILEQLETAPITAADRTRLLERAKALRVEIDARLDVIDFEQHDRLSRALHDREAARQTLFRIVLVCGVLGPLGALFAHLVIAGRLVRRLRQVEENARLLAHGLPLLPFASGSDEIAELAGQIEDAAFLLSARERELRGSEQRYRDLFDQAPIPYEETDRDGCVTRFNQAVCTLLKCAPDRIVGRMAWDFVAPDQQDDFRAAMMDRLSRGREVGPLECDYLLEDGTRIEVEIREQFIRSDSGDVTGVCRSLMDVTERNLAAMAARKVVQYAMELRTRNEQLARALDAARSATEAKSRFLAGISHELRTPLNGIIGFSELMHDGKVGPVSDEHREFLGDILTSARHLLRLINDILDLSKVEAGKMEFQPEPHLIGALVYEVRDVVWPLAEKKNIEFTMEVPAELTGEIDASRFKQVLYNYLSNAVKFTPPGGHVSVRVTVEGDSRFRLEVEDDGTGIAASEIGQLFQEFQQLPNSRKAEQGTGLGLALTRHIVEAQGGTVDVRSQPGRGSVFSAVLPLHGAKQDSDSSGH